MSVKCIATKASTMVSSVHELMILDGPHSLVSSDFFTNQKYWGIQVFFFEELAYLAFIYSLAAAHCQQYVSAEECMTLPNKLTIVHSVIMGLERWNLACLMAERMMNTVVLVLWRYLKHLLCRPYFCF